MTDQQSYKQPTLSQSMERQNLEAYLGLIDKVKQEPEVFMWINEHWSPAQ